MTNPVYPIDTKTAGNPGAGIDVVHPAGGNRETPLQMSRSVTENVALPGEQANPPGEKADALLYSSRVMNTYVEYLKTYYPDIEIDPILAYAGTTRHEVEDPGHWFTQQQTDRFYETVAARTGNPHIAREAGRFTVSGENLGTAKQYIIGLMNPATVYLMIGKLVRTLSRGADMKSRKLGANKVEIVSRPKAGTREKPYQCENRIGSLEAVAKAFTNKFAEI